MSNAICSIEGCDRSVRARGWCGAHYMRHLRHGDPLTVGAGPQQKPKIACSIEGCGRPQRSRGWCGKHWQAWAKHGDPTYEREHPIYRDPREAFAAHTEREGDCLVWTGHRDPQGYGYMRAAGKSPRGAHRVAWELANGSIPPGMVVRHKCDNPPCVDLIHLELGTQQDNMDDMVARGRAHWQRIPEETP